MLSPQSRHAAGWSNSLQNLASSQVAPDGLCSYCKPCNAAAAAERRAKRPAAGSPTIAAKVCSHCQQVRAHFTCRRMLPHQTAVAATHADIERHSYFYMRSSMQGDLSLALLPLLYVGLRVDSVTSCKV